MKSSDNTVTLCCFEPALRGRHIGLSAHREAGDTTNVN